MLWVSTLYHVILKKKSSNSGASRRGKIISFRQPDIHLGQQLLSTRPKYNTKVAALLGASKRGKIIQDTHLFSSLLFLFLF